MVLGHKSDVKDAEWIADILRHGLLKGSYIPSREQRELRELAHYRKKLIQERSREINRMQKVLEGANIKLSSVASDILGVSARSMLEAIINGIDDPKLLSQLTQGRMSNLELMLLLLYYTGLDREQSSRRSRNNEKYTNILLQRSQYK